LTQEKRDAIVADIKRGMTISATARKHNVGLATVQRLKFASGVSIARNRPQKLTAEIYQTMLDLRAQGQSYSDIADQVGFSSSATHRILTRKDPPNFQFVQSLGETCTEDTSEAYATPEIDQDTEADAEEYEELDTEEYEPTSDEEEFEEEEAEEEEAEEEESEAEDTLRVSDFVQVLDAFGSLMQSVAKLIQKVDLG
jgi:transcriptional regulator with XRE-family HTH domain